MEKNRVMKEDGEAEKRIPKKGEIEREGKERDVSEVSKLYIVWKEGY